MVNLLLPTQYLVSCWAFFLHSPAFNRQMPVKRHSSFSLILNTTFFQGTVPEASNVCSLSILLFFLQILKKRLKWINFLNMLNYCLSTRVYAAWEQGPFLSCLPRCLQSPVRCLEERRLPIHICWAQRWLRECLKNNEELWTGQCFCWFSGFITKMLNRKLGAPIICQNYRSIWRNLRYSREIKGDGGGSLRMSKDLIQATGARMAQEKKEEQFWHWGRKEDQKLMAAAEM